MRRTRPGVERGTSSGPAGHRIRLSDVLAGVVALVVTLVWAASLAPVNASRATAAWLFWGSLVALPCGAALHVVVHELGHLLAAQALRLRIVGFRIWRLMLGSGRTVAGSSGHVRVDLSGVRRWVPARMILLLLAGPAANLVAAAATAALVADRSASWGLRAVAVGFTVAGLLTAVMNLLPRRPTDELETDGLKALRWAFQPARAEARVALVTAPDRMRTVVAAPGTGRRPREQLRSAVEDPRPEVALAAMSELLGSRTRYDDGWQDVDAVAAFAARRDLPRETRATVSGNYAVSLGLAHLGSMPTGETSDPGSPTVRRIEDLAGLALTADPESLPARTAYGLVRVIQDRPEAARGALTDIASDAAPAVRARAYAVRGLAELDLGDRDRAIGLGTIARDLAPTEALVRLLDAVLASRTSGESSTGIPQ